MAEVRRGDIVVQLILETKQTEEKLKQLSDKFNQVAQAVKGTKLQDYKTDLTKLGQATQANVVPALVQLNYVIQDLPYGFRGVANNVQMFIQSLSLLRAQGLTIMDLLKQIYLTLTGPLGIIFGFSLLSSIIIMLSDRKRELQKEIEEENEEFEKLNKSIEKITLSMRSYSAEVDELKNQLNDLIKNFNLNSDAVFKLADSLDYFDSILRASISGADEFVKQMGEIEKSTRALQDPLYGIGNVLKSTTAQTDALKSSKKELNKELSKLFQVADLAKEVKKYENEIKELINTSKKLSEAKLELYLQDKPLKLVSLAIKELRRELEEVANKKRREEILSTLEKIENVYKRLSKIDKKEEIDKEKEAIQIIEARAKIESDEIKKIELEREAKLKAIDLDLKRGKISKDYAEVLKEQANVEAQRQKQELLLKQSIEDSKKLYELDKLRAETKAVEFEQIQSLQMAELNYLKRQFEMGLITQEEFTLRRLAIEREYQERVNRMRLDYFRDLSIALSGLAKEGTLLAKTLAIANALMNVYEGATKALAKYPPPYSFILASAVIASGMVYVGKIAGVSFEKGGFTGYGSKSEPAGIVHKGEFVFEKEIVDRERVHLEELRALLKAGLSIKDIISPSIIISERVINVIPPSVKNEIIIRADFDYLKFFIQEFKKFERYKEMKK